MSCRVRSADRLLGIHIVPNRLETEAEPTARGADPTR